MKKTLLTTFFFLSILQINAQQIALMAESEEQVSQSALNWENQKMRSDLSLNEAQFNEVKTINLERMKARNAVAKMFQYEPKKREAKIRELEFQYDGEFAEILTEKQYEKYLKLQNRQEEKVAVETIEPKAEEISFNAKIQELITYATTPALDSALLPKQDTTFQQIRFAADSLQEIGTSDSLQETGISDSDFVYKKIETSEPMVSDTAQNAVKLKDQLSENTLIVSDSAKYAVELKEQLSESTLIISDSIVDKLKTELQEDTFKKQEDTLKIIDNEEILKTSNGLIYKSEPAEPENRLDTPEKTIKHEDGKEEMGPEK